MNRFLSILFIVALGSGFMAGLAATSPDMYETADQYMDDYALYDVGIDQMVLALLRGATEAANGDCTAQGIAAGGEERNLLTVCGRKVNAAADCGGGVLLHGALVDAAVPSVVVEVPCVCQDGIADGCGIGVCVLRGGNAVPTHHTSGFICRRDTVDLAAHDPAGQAERCSEI